MLSMFVKYKFIPLFSLQGFEEWREILKYNIPRVDEINDFIENR